MENSPGLPKGGGGNTLPSAAGRNTDQRGAFDTGNPQGFPFVFDGGKHKW